MGPAGGFANFGYITGNVLATRPTANLGTSITASQNSLAQAYTQILAGASVAYDLFGLLLGFNSVATNATAKDAIANIGVDSSGGSSYQDLITGLLCSSCAPCSALGGSTFYYFPLFVPAGSSIGAKISVNNATPGTGRVIVQGFGLPRDRRTLRYGSFVESIGVTAASSSGTAVTPGQASEGTWTSLGTTSKNTWWAQQGFGINNGTMATLQYHLDCSVGDGTNFEMLLQDTFAITSTSEQAFVGGQQGPNGRVIVGGSTIYGRMQCSGAPDTGISQAVYMVGG